MKTSQNFFNQRHGNLLAPDGLADFFSEDKFDFTILDLLVKAHGGEQFLAFEGIQFDLHRQAGALEKISDPLNVAFRPNQAISCDNFAAATWPMEIASPCKNFP